MFNTRINRILVGLLTVLLVVACQSDPNRPPSNSKAPTSCHPIQHGLGKTCVPQPPKRLISLDDSTLANALILGVPSVGCALPDAAPLDYLNQYMEKKGYGTESLGQSTQPNVEKILMLKPDLILGVVPFGEPIYTQLAEIAPTAMGEWQGSPSWREHFDFVAHILGKEPEAKSIWSQYYQRIDALQQALGDRLDNLELSTIYAYGDQMTVDVRNSFAGSIFSDIGIQQPRNHSPNTNGVLVLSEERIPEIDADILFVNIYDAESKHLLDEWQKKPLWKQLKAVQSGQVYVVDANFWRGGNPIAANLMIDDLFKYLVNRPSA